MNRAPVPYAAEGQMAEVIERVAKLEEQYGAIMQRFDRVDGDIARVEGRLDAGLAEVKQSIMRLENRLDAGLIAVGTRSDAGIGEVKQSMAASFAEVKQSIVRLDNKLESGFKWMMGGIAGGFLTVVVLIIGQILFGR
jgi:hypothetical protein